MSAYDPRVKATAAWKALLAACAKLHFEPHDIAAQLDARGRYEVALTPEFPLSIKLFRYTSKPWLPTCSEGVD